MKMFLTRLGPNSKCVVTGDLSQIDLPWNVKSGLRQSSEILKNIDGMEHVYLTAEDVVRHRLVKEIIKAYDRDDEWQKAKREAEKAAKKLENIEKGEMIEAKKDAEDTN
jgi:phosphate starvation-inducible protein PhoH and related proteins